LVVFGEFHVFVEERVEVKFMAELGEIVGYYIHAAWPVDDRHPPTH
jgi:hypothetical protein